MTLPPKLSADAILKERRRAIIRNPFALLLHNWRLKRIRWAQRTLDRRLDAYLRIYGASPFATPQKEENL